MSLPPVISILILTFVYDNFKSSRSNVKIKLKKKGGTVAELHAWRIHPSIHHPSTGQKLYFLNEIVRMSHIFSGVFYFIIIILFCLFTLRKRGKKKKTEKVKLSSGFELRPQVSVVVQYENTQGSSCNERPKSLVQIKRR